MSSLHSSMSWWVPAYEYDGNSISSLYVSTSGLVPAYRCKLQALELQSFSLQECN